MRSMTDDERWARMEARWARSDAARDIQLARTEQAFNDLHEYMVEATQILARLAKSVNETRWAVRETGQAVREHRAAFEEESRAHREALWAVIDRFNGKSGPEPA